MAAGWLGSQTPRRKTQRRPRKPTTAATATTAPPAASGAASQVREEVAVTLPGHGFSTDSGGQAYSTEHGM